MAQSHSGPPAPAHEHSQARQHDHSHDVVSPHTHGERAAAGQPMVCCSHHEMDLERDMKTYLVGAVLVSATWLARNFLTAIPHEIAQLPAMIGAFLLAIPLFRAAISEVRAGRASSSTLAAIAILAAIATGEFETAGFLAFILLVADQFVRRTAFGAQRAIEQLVGLTPDTARLFEDGAEREVSLVEVKVGQVVRIRPGENLPVDGVVVTGRSTINQASLTGEAVPHEVQPGEPVYAGTTNISGAIDVRATQVGQDTTIGKVSELIRAAEQTRTPRQLLIEQVARFFVPVALSVAGIVWFLTRNVETAITVLIVACPSALLLASPSAMVAAFASAARLGNLIKNSSYQEAAASIDTVVVDKSGTITTGKFAVSKLVPAAGVEGAELLQAAANGEQHSNHPLARSILATATAARIKADGSSDYEEFHGLGIRARTSMGELHVGRASWLRETFPALEDEISGIEARIEGMTGVHVVRQGRYLGVVGLEDKIRPNTKAVIERLRELGVRQVAIFTGDRLSVAERVGRAVGVDAVEAECHPEEKHDQIVAFGKQGRRVMMVGDGINDGPSLAAADVGVAMGLGGSDIAANSAGVALMNDDLSRVPFLIELARHTRSIIAQNIAASIIIALIGLALAATGSLAVPLAALYHFVGDVFVIGNSFRLFRFGEAFSHQETPEGEQEVRQRTGPRAVFAPAAAAAP
ncbi:MAG: cation-translocating P-type ATPase [Phycisphaerales bacterium]|nr:cation-translocating P-type ATPase [Phycisphaerales bacterium]